MDMKQNITIYQNVSNGASTMFSCNQKFLLLKDSLHMKSIFIGNPNVHLVCLFSKIMRFSSLLGKHVETLLQCSLEIFTEVQKQKNASS